MANFKQDILEAANGETIEAFVGGPFKVPTTDIAAALAAMDYEYEAGFGSMDCDDITFWTVKHVFYIHEYDGSTAIHSVPRNPEFYKETS